MRASSSLVSTVMVQTHQNSREKGTTTPIPPQETEKIWHWSSDPQKVIQLHHREHWWLVASPPGVATARPTTARHYRGKCVRPSTSLGPSFPPSRTSIPGGVRGMLKRLTLVIDCSLCYRTASDTRLPSLGPKGFLAASTPQAIRLLNS